MKVKGMRKKSRRRENMRREKGVKAYTGERQTSEWAMGLAAEAL